MMQASEPHRFVRSCNFFGWILILCSSVLLGIWAVKGTIALRNILLIFETGLSFIYFYQFFKLNLKVPLKNWTPLFFLGLMLFWVIFHYLFLSRFPDQQLNELTSTWFRSGLAMIVGAGTGFAILRKPNAINFLWIGLLGSFLFLFYQYIPKAIALESLFAPDYVNYIFYGKVSGVLAGTIFVMGLLGTMLDTAKRGYAIPTVWVAILTVAGLIITLYMDVFIFDARNGVGLAVILLTIFCFIFIARYLMDHFGRLRAERFNIARSILLLLFVTILILVTAWCVKEHVQHNSRWSSLWEDAKISVQIEKYPHWQDPERLGYPLNGSGQTVMASTYERIAWATAGATRFLPNHPYGLGVLKNPFTILLREQYPNNVTYIPSSHSAWVEIGLAFGYPGLCLLLGALISLGYLSVSTKNSFRSTALLFSLGLLCLYTVAEASSQHAIEMLFFLISMATALLIPHKSQYSN